MRLFLLFLFSSILCSFFSFSTLAEEKKEHSTSSPVLLPEQLTFRKIFNHRYLFSTENIVSVFDKKKATLIPDISPLDRILHKNEITFSNKNGKEASDHFLLGNHIPSGIHEFEITDWEGAGGSLGLELFKDNANYIRLVATRHGETPPKLVLQVISNGRPLLERTIKNTVLTPPFTIKADFAAESIGNDIRRSFISIWEEVSGKPTLLEHKINLQTDFSSPQTVQEYKSHIYTELSPNSSISLSQAKTYITGGAAQADPKPLHDETGKILQEGEHIWLAMSVRGYDMNTNYQGVYKFNVKTGELTITSVLLFNLDNRNHYSSYHAADIIYHRKENKWLVFPTAHTERPHSVKCGIIPHDPRDSKIPFQFVNVSSVRYPNQSNEEDATLIFDTSVNKWRLAMCDQGKGGYQLPLLEASEWDGEYMEIARYAHAPCTGIQLQKLDGRYYVFFGRNVNNCEALRYPEMDHPVKLTILSPPRSYNVWPVIIPFRDESCNRERIYMMSFDRDTHGGAHSYGNIYLYEALEYPGMPSGETTDHALPPSNPPKGEIRTVADLMQLRNHPSGHFVLKNDLDLNEITDWTPIGSKETPFNGTLDGNGFTIKNLTIKKPQANYVGLFSYLGPDAVIKNIQLQTASIQGNVYVGGLAGYNEGAITNCHAAGSISAFSAGGMLAGQNTGIIEASSARGTATSAHGDGIGGLTGVNCANIGDEVPGKKGIIKNCSAEVLTSGPRNIGGLVGHNDCGTIESSKATGNVSGKSCIGGLVGNVSRNYGNDSTSPILNSTASGNISGYIHTGGLIGMNDGLVKKSSASGNVSGTLNVGGLIGTNNNKGELHRNSQSGSSPIPIINGSKFVGLIIGWNRGTHDCPPSPISSIRKNESALQAIGNGSTISAKK